MTIWTELDIEPTTDTKLIRRAYATRLRAIDPDSDPAAFQPLREAYDRAIARANAPAPAILDTEEYEDDEDDYFEDEAEQPSLNFEEPQLVGAQPQPPREPTPEEREREQFEQQVNAALAAGNSRAALDHLTSALARGLIHLGQREYALDGIMPAVVRDGSLSPQDFLAVLQKVGWDIIPSGRERISRTRHAAMARGNAERWYLVLQGDAVRKPWPLVKNPTMPKANWLMRYRKYRIANLLLHGTWFFPGNVRGVAMLGADVNLYRHHAPFIEHRFDPRNIRRAERALAIGRGWRNVRLGIFATAAALATLACIGAGFVSPGTFIGAFFFGRVTIALFRRLDRQAALGE